MAINNNNNNQLLAIYLRLLKAFVFCVICAVISILFMTFWGESIKTMFQPTKKASQVQLDKRAAEKALQNAELEWDKIENGIHLRSGMVYDENFQLVHSICTACHSAKLITQNKATKEGWIEMIRWMQKTQGLGQLGKNEATIVQYLSQHYAPDNSGRRANLDTETIEWYELN